MGLTNIGDKELVCQKYCIRLADETIVYRVVCDHCIDCDPLNYEIDFYTDELGAKIPNPDLTGSESCDSTVVNKIDSDCTDPINVNVCNQVDLTPIENLLGDILVELEAINENTDELEALINQLILDVQAGNVTLTQILSVLQDVLIELEAINENTDQIETLIGDLTALIQAEFDETQVILNNILDRLNTDCTDPIKVEVCNQIDLSIIEGLLADILVEVEAINENTDQLEAQLTQLIADVQAGNVTLTAILGELSNILSVLQDIDANTDDVETLIANLTATIQAEFDETQVILTNIFDKLNADCNDAVKVEICNAFLEFDTEKTPVCYTTDNGGTIYTGGTLIRVWEANPASGVPNPIPIVNQLLAQDGSPLNLGDPNIFVANCPPLPAIHVLNVCVDDGGNIVSKLQHIVHSTSINGVTQINVDQVFYTDTDGSNRTASETVVQCPQYQVGNPVVVCN